MCIKVVYFVIISLWSIFSLATCGDPIAYDVHPIKHGHHYYDAYYHHYLYKTGIITYLAFLAIKVKIALVLGAFFVFFMFAGKLFAVIKYAEYNKEKHHDHYHEPEKVYIQSPVHYDHGFKSPDLPDDLSHRIGVGNFRRPQQWPTRYSTLPSKYMAGGRALESEPWTHFIDSRKYEEINSIADGWDAFSGLVKRLNVTDVILNKLGMMTTTCKKKFICKLDHFAKGNWMVETSLKLLKDDAYKKYETKPENQELNCEILYQECDSPIK